MSDAERLDERLRRLGEILTERRRARIEAVLDRRIANVRLVLENLHDPFNVSACLRTAEAFGIQHVHIVGDGSTAIVRDVTSGAHRWLTIHRDRTGAAAARRLHEAGFEIVASTTEPGHPPLSDLQIPQRLAIAFGNEHAGLSQELALLTTARFHIPMSGFSQSLNVTVGVAASLRELILCGHPLVSLGSAERETLRYSWYLKSVGEKRARLLE